MRRTDDEIKRSWNDDIRKELEETSDWLLQNVRRQKLQAYFGHMVRHDGMEELQSWKKCVWTLSHFFFFIVLLARDLNRDIFLYFLVHGGHALMATIYPSPSPTNQ